MRNMDERPFESAAEDEFVHQKEVWHELVRNEGKLGGNERSDPGALAEAHRRRTEQHRNGDRNELIRALVRRYGFSRQQAETEICEFEKDVRWPGAVK